jgi:hypothetical protein
VVAQFPERNFARALFFDRGTWVVQNSARLVVKGTRCQATSFKSGASGIRLGTSDIGRWTSAGGRVFAGFVVRRNVVGRGQVGRFVERELAIGHELWMDCVMGAGRIVDAANTLELPIPTEAGHSTQTETRYSPAKISGCEKIPQLGKPDEDRICTSHVERFNLTMRMNLRRFTRLTNGHSKSLKHHVAMQGLLFAWYNFVRVHTTIKATPAMASGLAESVWSLRKLIDRAAMQLRYWL